MKKVVLVSLVLTAGVAQGIVWVKTLDNFLLACVMALLGGIAVGCLGDWIITR